MLIRQNPLWLWNPEETSLEIQNRSTSGPKIGRELLLFQTSVEEVEGWQHDTSDRYQ